MSTTEIVLNIDPPVWNVVKFLGLAVVATPLLELLFHRVIDSKATYDVLTGKQLSLRESNLTVFSLHSSYWGPSRNKLLLLLIALPILAADLLVEFSFSATTIDVSERTQVWLQPRHRTLYTNLSANGFSPSNNPDFVDPSQFPPETAPKCIEGPRSFYTRILENTAGDTDEYNSGFEYRMNGTYVIRNSYLTSDNRTIVCSSSKTVGEVNFVFPDVVQVRGTTRGEGVNLRGNNTDSNHLRAVFSQAPFQYIGKTVLTQTEVEIWVSENVTCGDPQDHGQLCAAIVGDTFILANTTAFESSLQLWSYVRPLSNVTLSVILSASGAPINRMKSRERRIRLLASLAGSRLMTSHVRGDQPSQRLITKDTLEQISFMIMSVANEEGVGGVREEKGFRAIRNGEKQSATMKRTAFIPIGILLFLMLALAAVDCVYCLLITRKLRNDGVKRASIGKVRARMRVNMSIQWFSERVLDDLRACSIFQNVSPSDVSAKHVTEGDEEWFQLLPLSSSQHQHEHIP